MELLNRVKRPVKAALHAAALPVARGLGGWRRGGRVYDAFLFNQEMELLEARLGYLYPHVDYFVLGESAVNFVGQPKPLYFQENAARFQKYADKIRHVVIPPPAPEQYDPSLMDARQQSAELYHRRALAAGLAGAGQQDIILYSDADEIPRASAIATIRGLLRFGYPAAILEMSWHLLYPNTLALTYLEGGERCCWLGTIGTTFRNFQATYAGDFNRLWQFRWGDMRKVLIRVPDGGWHLSFLGGMERLRKKQRDGAYKSDDPDEISRLRRKEFVGVRFGFFDEQALFPPELKAHLGPILAMARREEDFIREVAAFEQT